MSTKKIEAIYPLSPMQQGLLFHSLYAPDSGLYVEQMTCELRGPVDDSALERAWQRVVDRHSVLRTAFVWEKLEQPVQVVHQQVKVSLNRHDWRELSGEVQKERLAELLQNERGRAFELSKAPLIRLSLIRLAEDTYRFVWNYHHLLLDGWCLPLVLKEVFAYYEAYRSGRQMELEPSRPYRDYIAWLQRQDTSAAEAFWRETLKGFTAPTRISAGKTSNDSTGGEGGDAERSITLPASVTSALQEVARREQLTLNTIVQGAWALLLSRYGGEPDVLFGATVSGRPPALEGVERMVGLFINTLPVRARVEPSAPAAEWLRGLQRRQVETRQYEYSPLVQVRQWSEVPSGEQLFDSIFVFENYPVDKSLGSQSASLAISGADSIARSNYPLTIMAVAGSELLVRMIFKRDCFDAATVERMLDGLRVIIEGFASDPQCKVSELPLLREAEEREILEKWNRPSAAYKTGLCIHELFEAQARRTPEAIAVSCEGVQLSYAELDARSNRLARHLRAHGVGAESLVGLLFERSVEMVVGVLAVLKAGGAYVPLDPSYPQERLQFMAADAGLRLVVTHAAAGAAGESTVESVRAALTAAGVSLVCLDADADDILHHTAEPLPESGVTAENLAYVIYTSGSTGTPKGVGVPHRAVVRLVRDTDYARFDADEVFLLLAPVSFDASTFELWGPLLNGARLVVMPPETPSLAELAEAITRHGVTTLWLTAGLFHLMVDEQPEALRGLRQLLAGGDVLSPSHVERLLADGAGCVLINGYGPTENTTFTCTHRMEPGRQSAGASVPIGRPIANTRVYVLDERMRPVPVGVAGELYVGGEGLARGYLDRPSLTAERFVPDLFAAEPGGRLYRTGDFVRWLADGTIEFLGRLDTQVKLRGFRIEPGEIEAALCVHERVRAAAVVAAVEGDGKRLVAYVVPRAGVEPVTSAELRRFLAQQLPEYMVPSAFVLMEELPLTSNGKLDRRALPAPEEHGTRAEEDESSFVGARNALEEALVKIWSNVLGGARVGVHDNFFDLGGHSLKATQVVSRISKELRTHVSFRDFFTSPTVAELAQVIEGAKKIDYAPLAEVEGQTCYELSHAQYRMWIACQAEHNSVAYNLPAAYLFEGALDVDALKQALTTLVGRHESLRTTFVNVGGEPRQQINPDAGSELKLLDMCGYADAERRVRDLAAAEALTPFDLANGPLLRVTLAKLAAERYAFLCTVHHIISDGWSMNVLVGELLTLYAAYRRGQENPLPPPRLQYKDYAAWQRRELEGAQLAGHRDYWVNKLAGDLPALGFPPDHPRPAVQTFNGAVHDFEISGDLARGLSELSRESGTTLFMVLLSSLYALLYRSTGQRELTLGTPISGRVRGELEGQIGLYLNMLALRTEVGGEDTFGELLARVRQTTLDAYEHQTYPFDRLVADLKVRRDAGGSPFFNLGMTLQNQNSRLPSEGLGIQITPVEFETTTSQYDMWFLFSETAEGIAGSIRYNTDLYSEEAVALISSRLLQLLGHVTADAGAQVMDIDFSDSFEAAGREDESLCIELSF